MIERINWKSKEEMHKNFIIMSNLWASCDLELVTQSLRSRFPDIRFGDLHFCTTIKMLMFLWVKNQTCKMIQNHSLVFDWRLINSLYRCVSVSAEEVKGRPNTDMNVVCWHTLNFMNVFCSTATSRNVPLVIFIMSWIKVTVCCSSY